MYTIQSCITEALYDHNLTSPDSTCLQILVSKRLQLLSELSEWRRETSSFCEILSPTDLENFGSSSLGANNFRVLLSIQYYKTALLINAAVLIRLLANRAKNTTETTLPFEYTIPVIRDDFSAASILQRILHGAATCGGTFLDSNAAWWTCNYTCRHSNPSTQYRAANEQSLHRCTPPFRHTTCSPIS